MENKCPHDGSTLELSHMMYIEVCPKCQYCFDVFHGKEVDYGWVYGVDDDEAIDPPVRTYIAFSADCIEFGVLDDDEDLSDWDGDDDWVNIEDYQ